MTSSEEGSWSVPTVNITLRAVPGTPVVGFTSVLLIVIFPAETASMPRYAKRFNIKYSPYLYNRGIKLTEKRHPGRLKDHNRTSRVPNIYTTNYNKDTKQSGSLHEHESLEKTGLRMMLFAISSLRTLLPGDEGHNRTSRVPCKLHFAMQCSNRLFRASGDTFL